MIYDVNADGKYDTSDVLLFDINGDGEVNTSRSSIERIAMREPFNVTGTPFEVASIASDGLKLTFKKSDKPVAFRGMPTVGQKALPLSGRDFAGKTVSLEDFRGKLTLVMFWAEW